MKVEKDDWLNEALDLVKNWSFGVGIIVGLAKISRDGYFSGYIGRTVFFLMFLLGILIVSFSSYKFFNNVFVFHESGSRRLSSNGFLNIVAAIISGIIIFVALGYAVHLEVIKDSVSMDTEKITIIYE